MAIEDKEIRVRFAHFRREERAMIQEVVKNLRRQDFKVTIDADGLGRSRFGLTNEVVDRVSTKLTSATSRTLLTRGDLWVIRAGLLDKEEIILLHGQHNPELEAQRHLTQQLYRKCFIRSV